MSENAEKSIEEMLVSNDPSERQAALNALNNPMETPAVPEESVTPVGVPLAITESSTVEQPLSHAEVEKKIKVLYRGMEVEKEDPDGFLGRKSLEGLKLSKAHADEHIKYVETEYEKAQRKIAELQAEVERSKMAPAVPVQPVATQTVIPTSKPVKPKLENPDPSYWTAEESVAMNKYWEDLAGYVDTIQSSNPRLQEIEDRISKYDSKLQYIDQLTENTKKQEVESKYWGEIDSFRNTHPEFRKASINIKDLNHKVDDWGRTLAIAAGYNPPANSSSEEINRFESTKIQVMDKYMKGDQSLLSTGVTPPDGFDEVFRIAALERDKNKLISDGILGKNATLHEAWLYKQDRTGAFDSTINNLEADARRRGAESVMNVARQKQSEEAVTLPDGIGKPASSLDGITPERAKAALSASVHELQMNPELREIKKQLLSL